MRKATIFIVLALLLTLCVAPVYAQGIPPVPHAFYGDLWINGSLARAGTIVEAKGEGVIAGRGNPITTTEVGKYGSANPLEAKLVVQGDIPPGATITFYVTNANGTAIGGTYPFDSGETNKFDLYATIAAPAFVGNGGAAPPTVYVETNLFGTTASFSISSEGKIQETIEATSEDGMLTLTIPKGTIALDKDGNPLESIEATIDESPPDPPEGAHIIELVYNFKPDGATFDPPITLEYTYDPGKIPEGVAEEDLVLAYYDEDAGKWVELECVVDTENNTITASVSHFTTFAIIGRLKPAFTLSSLAISPAELAPEEKVSISVSVANTGGLEGSYAVILKINGVKEAEKSVTIAAGRKQSVTFSVTRKEAGSYSVVVDGLSGSFTVVAPAPAPPVVAPAPAPAPAPPVAPPPVAPPAAEINWPVLGGIIAGAVILIVVVVLLIRRRRTY